MSEWRAHVRENWSDLGMRRVFFSRLLVEDVEYISGFDATGRPTIERAPQNTVSDFQGLLIPAAALEALAERLKPGPSQGETRRLEEALQVEQQRVDKLLARALDAVG